MATFYEFILGIYLQFFYKLQLNNITMFPNVGLLTRHTI